MAKKAPKIGDIGKKTSSIARMYYEESRAPPTAAELASANQPLFGYEDMTKMDDMNEVTLLGNVKERYIHDLIYTYCSAILVAVNPFKFLPIYNQAWVVKYKGHRLGIQPPHIYAISEAAYSTMVDKHEDVSVLISGESGAGKTECTKLLLRYLAARMDKVSKTEAMLLETVPILDVIGNAKTVRNDNSSRFGKYIEIIFDNQNMIAGSKITTYLLEKSRIIWQADTERNFHLFYQVTEGPTDEDRQAYHLKNAMFYRYLNRSGCISLDNHDEKDELKATKKAFRLFDIDQETEALIFRCISAVLWLGNFTFKENKNGASEITSMEALEVVAKLTDLKKEDVLAGVRTKKLTVRGEVTIVELNPEKAKDSADALAKLVYSCIFDWIVKKLNESLFADKYTSSNFIGVLDIFGFENFKFNSLEQLLINFANEKLQKFFNHHIFSMEQEEYEREKINWRSITFKDNQECLDLIEKRPTGILFILDEECRFPKASDNTFLQKVNQSCEKHPNFEKLRIVKSTFKILHYAGNVEYDTTGWLDKNKDEIPDHTMDILQSCPTPWIAELFKPDPATLAAAESSDPSGRKKKGVNKLTVGAQFKNSLTALNDKMLATAPYFVRCIKPNMMKRPDDFNDVEVQAQLRYAGMLETIRIRRLGYPIRYLFKEFYQRYKCLVHSQYHSSGDYSDRCQGMLAHIDLPENHFQKGVTKVFLKQEAANVLEDRRAVTLGRVILVAQCWYRMIVLRKRFKQAKIASLQLQKWYRCKHMRRFFKHRHNEIIKIQNYFRMGYAIRKRKVLLEEKRKKQSEADRKKEEEKAKRDIDEALLLGKDREAAMAAQAERRAKEAKDRELAGPAAEIKVENPDLTIYCPAQTVVGLKWWGEKVVDLDLSALVLDKNGNVVDACYYNQKETEDKALKLSEDDRLGEKKAPKDNEAVAVDFTKITNYARFVAVLVNCYSDGYSFNDADETHVEIRDSVGKLLWQTQVKKEGKQTGYFACVLAKSGEKWICQPYEKFLTGTRWMESLVPVQKTLQQASLIQAVAEEKAFPKPFRGIKGEEIVIPSTVSKLLCGLGWVGSEDLDLAVLLFRYTEFIDHIDPVRRHQSKDGAIIHKGDSKTGKGTDDERVYVDLSGISRRVNTIFFLVTVFNQSSDKYGGGFAKVRDAHVRLVDATSFQHINEPDRELCRFQLSRTCGNRSAQIMAKMWRNGPSKWNVIAMGEPSSGLFYEQMIPRVKPFLDPAPAMRTLKISIHSGKNLPADLAPYFRVRFDMDSAKTKTIKGKKVWDEELVVSGQALALDIGIFHHKMGKDKFFGQICAPIDKDFEKKGFLLEDRGKKKEKIAQGSQLIISLKDITGSQPTAAAAGGDKSKSAKKTSKKK